MTRYIDIHSHTPSAEVDVLTVCNVHADFGTIDGMAACSVGIHPWYVTTPTRTAEGDMTMLASCALHQQVVAIGECGLDALCKTPMALQETVFQQQVDLANQLGKPLMIHCVRAYARASAILKRAAVPVVFHGFVKNPALARDLLGRGFYLSFGAALTQGKKNAIDSLVVTPVDRLFLETDDSNMSIKDVYRAAADIRGVPVSDLIAAIGKNYQTILNRK